MKQPFYIANNRPLTHILFWIAYLLVYTGVHADGEDFFLTYFQIELQKLPPAILVAYINMYLLFPLFFIQRKYVAYSLWAVVLLFIASVVGRALIERVIEPLFYADTTVVEEIFIGYLLLKSMLWFLSPILLFTLVLKVFRQWVDQEQYNQEMAKEKLATELNFLKAQVQPHFLFNTLNNLYALTLQASPVAPRVVLKLSELMSYMLYDSQSDTLLLSKEISHIQNYIELEKLRYTSRLDLSLNVSGDIHDKRIAPLLLIPFVENAFKHGVSNETNQIWVTIDIKVKDNWLSVKVENSHTGDEVVSSLSNNHNGLGLQNIARRLKLLYPNDHELVIKKETDRYLVDLKIKIS
ncbi:sensor histidine kinase [Xanthocytophaga flava]|uniref:sensor histidine kinase n=1 Tax=Xanthocytophaga flava TaxID=3048013 RepID=UPI0028CFE820|nr:histidine kinase [Xanthocytophaga flavus]MDJ1472579.1 histidine kinase [Xanthocytophaga flavus]